MESFCGFLLANPIERWTAICIYIHRYSRKLEEEKENCIYKHTESRRRKDGRKKEDLHRGKEHNEGDHISCIIKRAKKEKYKFRIRFCKDIFD